jgi:hypothetical protein
MPANPLRPENGFIKRVNWANQREYEEPWIVELNEGGIANLDLGVGGLPEKGSAHPVDNQALARGLRVTGIDGRVAQVSIIYTTAETAFSGARAFDVTGSAYTWHTETRVEVVDLPYAVLKPHSSPNPGTGPMTTDEWEFETSRVEEVRNIIRVRWSIFNPGANEHEAIAEQTNKVHLIGGVWALFSGGTLNPKGDGLNYEFAGTWVVDEGTPTPEFQRNHPRIRETDELIDPTTVRSPWTGPPWTVPTNYLRAPFHELKPFAVFEIPFARLQPRLYHRPRKHFEPDGYKQLPSIPSGFP